ncbi:dystrophia myotonica WD repeat-containing protein [Eublepharis macularius]|uniref:Dystrophia myotonica WD repeat-containing protein n=1 Tax=Eublepharis macularius TaxID=481883 RepID=A0AA97KHF5_EUBMA|nr:dystrophia myotonica WD repeat-containing protein [Eublepharis macularius]
MADCATGLSLFSTRPVSPASSLRERGGLWKSKSDGTRGGAAPARGPQPPPPVAQGDRGPSSPRGRRQGPPPPVARQRRFRVSARPGFRSQRQQREAAAAAGPARPGGKMAAAAAAAAPAGAAGAALAPPAPSPAPGPEAGPSPPPAAHEIKSQFRTREGAYRLLGAPEPRARPPSAAAAPPSAAAAPAAPLPPPGAPPAAAPAPPALPPVRLSLVRLGPPAPDPAGPEAEPGPAALAAERSRVCFNLGRELYFYSGAGGAPGRGRRSIDLKKPIDKRIYKGTQPTCHDFNQFTAASESISLLVGFSAGQVQYLDLIKKDTSKLFNEERLIDKTKVTFVKWIPETESLFLASHASGHLYLYNVEHPCGSASPQYTLLKQGEGFTVYACKSKSARNPLLKWAVGEGALNEFAFSPDGRYLACVSQDGCLRVFHFDSMLLQGMMKSYFGGLLCVCWSPDGRYIVTGGEDDLVTVWSFAEGRVIARGHGHKSWVNAVAFDPFTTSMEEDETSEFSGSDEDVQDSMNFGRVRTSSTLSHLSKHSTKSTPSVTYRFGSAGQDTQFCLWDLTEDVLYPHHPLSRARTLTNTFSAGIPPSGSGGSNLAAESGGGALPRSLSRSNSLPHPAVTSAAKSHVADGAVPFSIGKFATLTLQERKDKNAEREHKRYHSLGNISKSNDKLNVVPKSKLDTAKVLGTALCPRINEVPLLEPLVCKKIAHERLTVLLFLEDCIITACQEGLICTWARPGKATVNSQNGGSPSGTVV